MADNSPPYGSPVDEKGEKLTQPWHRWFSQLYRTTQKIEDYSGATRVVLTTGFNYQIKDMVQVLMLTPAGTLATGTLVFPVNPVDGQSLLVSSTFNVTTLTISSSGSETIMNKPTTLVRGVGFKYFYNSDDTTWYRIA